ncbi:AraC family transcriptional regulator [Paenibacillus sp. GSMTC-2017]|uniref:GyrI-like domain-containing protein n=1 Tax=Paenibacillus sp. GSMTC-2017 TaxID=2794350 RepID=UPI0018D925A5|nr:GyrI-like domain-containing protein [Paenibacillus sp. GSMTC-2017]MBH5319507.1 AraC family transcriptional regulator [Paenibacillus sp. GSMTC-2017]
MEQRNESVLVTKESFRAVGLKWSGTFAEAGAGRIRVVQEEMQARFNEIKHVLNPEILLGLSYQDDEVGFTHYSVVEVAEIEDVPKGMKSITVPALTYAKCEHTKGQTIDISYNNIYAWIESQDYRPCDDDVTHVERYPMHQDPYTKDPEFTIMIPVKK